MSRIHYFVPIVLALVGLSTVSSSPNPACRNLSITYPDQLYWPETARYENEASHFWSEASILSPCCVFSPATASDVARAVSILRSSGTRFAVRGGGHMPIKGAASIENGVLIVMTQLNSMQLSRDGAVASIGPGLTWGEVYTWIGTHKRVVLGGRYSTVGVPGVLLGGGISYYSGIHGWAANHVVNYELVTADSCIVNVNASSQSDLFWALKGGSSNYGIVTRFDLETFPEPMIYGGSIVYNTSAVPLFLDALIRYLTPGGGVEDGDSALVPALFVSPPENLVEGYVEIFHNSPDPAPASLVNFSSIPTVANSAHVRTYSDLLTETSAAGNTSFRQSFHSISFRATASTISLLNTTITETALEQLHDVADCFLGLSFQPITQAWLAAARASGGDAIDLDPAAGTFIAFNLNMRWSSPSDDARMAAFADDMLRQLSLAAAARGLAYPFVFLNDAGSGQNPFPLYGGGRSLARMKAVRDRWDPDGVFQLLMPGGFKLGM